MAVVRPDTHCRVAAAAQPPHTRPWVIDTGTVVLRKSRRDDVTLPLLDHAVLGNLLEELDDDHGL